MPHMPSPVTLSDFFTASIDRGGLDGMLALNGIFHLMTKHQLEYPKFYDRLYGLLDSSCFRAANRRGFFELLDVFLKSPALPAYLAGAFIKRMSRLAIHAPHVRAPCSPSRTVTTCCEGTRGCGRDGAQGKRKVDGIGPFRGGRARPGAVQGAGELHLGDGGDVQALPRAGVQVFRSAEEGPERSRQDG